MSTEIVRYRCWIEREGGGILYQQTFESISALEAARRTAIGSLNWIAGPYNWKTTFPVHVYIMDASDRYSESSVGKVTVDVGFSATIRNPRGDSDKVFEEIDDDVAGDRGPSTLQSIRESVKAMNELDDALRADAERRAADVAGVMQPIVGDRGTSMDPRPPGFEFRPHAEFLKQEFSKFVDGLNLPESVVADRAPITRPASAESIVGGEKQ